MIVALARFVARSLLELGVLVILAGVLLVVISFRTVRRFLVTGEDPLEEIARPLFTLLAVAAAASKGYAGRQSDT